MYRASSIPVRMPALFTIRRGSTYEVSLFGAQVFSCSFNSIFLLLTFFSNSALAHHPFGMGESTDLSAWQALLSGIGHPLLGPDHLLFMLGIALVGLKRSIKWILPLLAVGLGGSALVQLQPLPD